MYNFLHGVGFVPRITMLELNLNIETHTHIIVKGNHMNEIIKNTTLEAWTEYTATELSLTSPDQYDENTEAMILELDQYKTLGVK